MSLRLPSRFHLILSLLGALLVLFVVGPILRLLIHASPQAIGQTLRDPEFAAAITLTIVTATTATLLGLFVGVPLAYLLARRPFRGRGLVQGLIELPIVIPHPVAGIALLLFLGRNSALGGSLASIGLEFVNHIPGIIVAMMFVSTPILVSGAREAFEAIDPRLERVARTLGDSPWGSFRRISLPLAGRGVAAAASLAWARSVSEFGAIVILTYNPKVASVFIFDRFTGFGLQAAIAPAVVLLVIALMTFGVIRLLQPAVPR